VRVEIAVARERETALRRNDPKRSQEIRQRGGRGRLGPSESVTTTGPLGTVQASTSNTGQDFKTQFRAGSPSVLIRRLTVLLTREDNHRPGRARTSPSARWLISPPFHQGRRRADLDP
jgi:hypothetical protein